MPPYKSPTDPSKPRHHKAVPKSLTTSSPSLGPPTLTVGQIAERLSTTPPEAAATRERLRHWTREGLLLPVARHHEGTGKHRQYEWSSQYDAAILNAVARAGLHIVSRPYLFTALSKARVAREKWERTEYKGPLFLVILHMAAGGDTEIAIHEGEPKCDLSAELSIVINLGRIFADIRASGT
jgi:hypothetical protein